jgi:hypothetical protein
MASKRAKRYHPLMGWEDVLLEAGVDVHASAADFVELRAPGGVLRARVEIWARPRHPSEVAQRLGRWREMPEPALVVAEALSPTVRTQLEQFDVSYVTSTEVFLALPPPAGPLHHVMPPTPLEAELPRLEPALRLPWRGRSAYQVLRRVIQRGLDRPQRLIARDAHVSQPRVAQTLATLGRLGLVDRDRRRVVDLPALLDAWMRGYPGPGGVTTRWFAPESPVETATRAIRHFKDIGGTVHVSGSVAADQLAPYALPTRFTLYADHLADLSVIGLVRTPDPATANLSVTVAEDATVRPAPDDLGTHADLLGSTGVLADHLQVLWDTAREDDVDSDQAVRVLRSRLLEAYEEHHA